MSREATAERRLSRHFEHPSGKIRARGVLLCSTHFFMVAHGAFCSVRRIFLDHFAHQCFFCKDGRRLGKPPVSAHGFFEGRSFFALVSFTAQRKEFQQDRSFFSRWMARMRMKRLNQVLSQWNRIDSLVSLLVS